MDQRQLIALLRGSIQFEREMTQINADLHRQVMHLNERYRLVSEENARLHAFLLAGLTLTAEQRHLYETVRCRDCGVWTLARPATAATAPAQRRLPGSP